MKPDFVTFAAGGYAWRATGRRLCRQANRTNYFSNVKLIGEDDVKSLFKGEQFSADAKGFGYWRWKPRIVWEAMQVLSAKSPGLWYVDAGSTIFESNLARKRFHEYLDFGASEGKGTFFQLPTAFSDYRFTKGEAFVHIPLASELAKSGQIQATAFFLSNSHEGRELAREWCRLSYQTELFDDSKNFPSEDSTIELFGGHRHDQSILSLLLKTRNVNALPDELNVDRATLLSLQIHPFPIAATRHRSGFDSLSMHPAMRAVRAIERSMP